MQYTKMQLLQIWLLTQLFTPTHDVYEMKKVVNFWWYFVFVKHIFQEWLNFYCFKSVLPLGTGFRWIRAY